MNLNKLELAVIALIAVILVAVVFGEIDKGKRKQAFMADCLKDRKMYECEALREQAYPTPRFTHVMVH